MALIGSVTRVDSLVRIQVRTANKIFPAHKTLIGSFSGVDSPMFNERGTFFKTFLTLQALVRLLSRVAALMDNEA